MTDYMTHRLALPLLQPGQAQKEMAHNEALALLDMVVQGAAVEAGLDVPPASPELGASWILGASPSGAWTGHAHEIAGWTGAGWIFMPPREGTRLWLGANRGMAVFSSGEWRLGEVHGKVFVEGDQVVGPRLDSITEPLGGVTVDAEARATIVSILEAMRAHGLIDND
ncbi:DUF2793 domain-containing protein [Sphingomonas sp. LM7]|uniref:DUF2793 domain-containing protein n=1 Tax=Sphingomonas sp. LM7 TaxID=1938607 RepID=UPI000983AFF6|nr:DUF2793 domain-containing protein [Sphingomonas sp. LM7]AQR74422.1 hypothetical protein BXU08_12855 [Sphingomonas sp. LM7]